MLFQDSSLLGDLSNILDEETSKDYLGLSISSQNTLDTRQGSLVFFDVKVLSKFLSGEVPCCSQLRSPHLSASLFCGEGVEVQVCPPRPWLCKGEDNILSSQEALPLSFRTSGGTWSR